MLFTNVVAFLSYAPWLDSRASAVSILAHVCRMEADMRRVFRVDEKWTKCHSSATGTRCIGAMHPANPKGCGCTSGSMICYKCSLIPY